VSNLERGKEFERIVAQLYERMGFEVETNKLLRGRSGAIHEIDVYAVKKYKKNFGILRNRSREICVECKYKNDGDVTKAEIANFLLKTDDLRIKECYVVTNSCFSEYALIVAKNYGVGVIDGSELDGLCKEYGVKNNLCSCKPTPLTYMINSFVDILDSIGIFRPSDKQ
jgi:CRISPR/Cas system CMR subunit Cmr6 (Cas7 group RAMP superfamily)